MARMRMSTEGGMNFAAAQLRRRCAGGYDGLGLGFRRVIALVRHADEVVAQPECVDDLGRAGKQRQYSHGSLASRGRLPNDRRNILRIVLTISNCPARSET